MLEFVTQTEAICLSDFIGFSTEGQFSVFLNGFHSDEL